MLKKYRTLPLKNKVGQISEVTCKIDNIKYSLAIIFLTLKKKKILNKLNVLRAKTNKIPNYYHTYSNNPFLILLTDKNNFGK